MVFYLRRHPEYFDRYLFGTDYPLSACATPFVGRLGFIRQFKLWGMRNTFDKQAAIFEALGLKLQSETTKRLLQSRLAMAIRLIRRKRQQIFPFGPYGMVIA
jgi:hypothetical protein